MLYHPLIKELDPGCGLEDFNKVLGDYSFVTSLYTTYSKELSAGAYSSQHPDDRPEVNLALMSQVMLTKYFQLRAYYLSEFGRKAKHALHCITSKVTSLYVSMKISSYLFPGWRRFLCE